MVRIARAINNLIREVTSNRNKVKDIHDKDSIGEFSTPKPPLPQITYPGSFCDCPKSDGFLENNKHLLLGISLFSGLFSLCWSCFNLLLFFRKRCTVDVNVGRRVHHPQTVFFAASKPSKGTKYAIAPSEPDDPTQSCPPNTVMVPFQGPS